MSISHPVIHGYYRFPDIYHQWAFTHPEESSIRAVLKGLLSPVALTHKDHPLRTDENECVQLWIGTFRNGKLQLLFSSAQVEYIRYWIKEHGYTGGITIPIPDSSFLLLPGKQLRSVSPVAYNDTKAIKNAQKSIEKANRRLLSPTELLISLRSGFEKVRNCWHDKRGTWCAIDFETWERDHLVVTEFGMSSLSWKNEVQEITDKHLIVRENKKYVNSTFVQGNRDHFLFGESQEMRLAEIRSWVNDTLAKLLSRGPVFLLFHTRGEDVRILRSWKAPLQGATSELPDELPTEGVFFVDTVDMFAALSGHIGVNRSLERMCRLLDLQGLDRFHNAGNDARFTLMAVRAMADGPPLDMQRDLRWPNQTNPGIQVEWKPWQDFSDWSETEGVLNPSKARDRGGVGPVADTVSD